MSVAEATREAVRERPYLYDALRAGMVNYTAAARTLGIDGETEAVATALRRFAEELDSDPESSEASVSMVSGLGRVESGEAVLSVGDETFADGAGSLTAIVASGDCSARSLGDVLGRLRVVDIPVEAAAGTDGTVAVVVARRDGPDALRVVEDAVGR